MKNILTLFCFLTSITLMAQTETLIYDLNAAGSTIGTLTAIKETKGNLVTYTSNSDVTIHFFGETKVLISLKVIYDSGILQSSTYNVLKDGQPYDNATLHLENGIYTFIRKGNSSKIEKPIMVSANTLYFDEPKNVDRIFAELEGIYKNIAVSSDNTYLLTDPGNHHTNTYVYAEGILQNATIDHAIVNFTLTLRNN